MRDVEVYDIELLRNLLMVSFKKFRTNEVTRFLIFEDTNQIRELVEHLRGKTLVSFNGFHYDDIIMNYVIDRIDTLSEMSVEKITSILFNLSQMVINYDSQSPSVKSEIRKYKYMTHFQGIDVMRINNIQKSLKLTATNLKWHKIQDLPIHWNDSVREDQIEEMFNYNDNDNGITEAIFEDSMSKIDLRYNMTEKYGVNVINESDSGIFNKLFDKLYSEAINQPVDSFRNLRTKRGSIKLGEVILPNVKFRTPELRRFREEISNLEVDCTADKLTLGIPELTFRGFTIQFGAGGIHSVDSGAVYRAEQGIRIIDADVASMYPATIINYNVVPEHLGSQFIDIYRGIRDTRVVAKRTKDKTTDAALKIVVNTAYGKMNSKYHWMYDPKAALTVTINGQLFLLMLIEALMCFDIEVISANTDGVTCRVKKGGQETVYKSICKQWERWTKYELEYVDYKTYFRRDVNNYTAETIEGKIKYKGIFNPELYKDLTKAFSMPIVAKALNDFYLKGINIEDTIKSHTDIYDFCSSNKVGNTFKRVEYHVGEVVTEVQRSIRYYVSIDGGYLYKIKENEDGTESPHALLANTRVTIFNDYVDGPYNIDYRYYIEEVNKLIAAINNKLYIHPDDLEAKITKLKEAIAKNQEKYDTFIAKKSRAKAVETTRLILEKRKLELEELIKLRS